RRVFFLFDGPANFLTALLHSILNDFQSVRAGVLNELSDVARVPERRLERFPGEFSLLGGRIPRALELEIAHHCAGLADRLSNDFSLLHRYGLGALRCSLCRLRQRIEIFSDGLRSPVRYRRPVA